MLDSIQNFLIKLFLAFVALVVCALFFGLDAAISLLTIGILLLVASRLWSLWRLWASVAASKGNEAAMALEKLRFQSSLFKFLSNIVIVATFVLVLLLCLKGGMPAEYAPVAAVIAAVLCGAPFWSKATRCWRQYEGGFKTGFVNASLSGVFDNLKYSPNGEFDKVSLQSLDFFEHFDRFSGNDLIEAEYKGIHFVQGDVRVQEHYTVVTRDSNGDTRTSHRWRTVFFGRAMRFDFADAFRGPVQVVQKDFGGAKVRSSGEWRRVETELAEFALDFDIFARDPIDAMAVLTPMMVEGIFYLYHKLACPMAFYFTGNAMFVVFPLKRDSFDVSAGRTLLEERKWLERDVAIVTGFLDTMYFKRQAVEKVADDTVAPATAGTERKPVSPPDRGEFVRSPTVEAARLKRAVANRVGAVFQICLYVVFAAYLLSLLYAFRAFPNGIALGFSYSDGEFSLHEASFSIGIYILLVNGIFVLPFAAAACFKSKSIAASLVGLVPTLIHFLVLYVNALSG